MDPIINQEEVLNPNAPAELSPKENVWLGIIGALLFSLAGALVFFLLHLANFIAGLSGFAAIFAAFYGYGLFSGNKKSRKGIIIAAIAAVLSMVFANYFCVAFDFFRLLREEGASYSLMAVLKQTFSLLQGEIVWGYELDRSAFVKDLLISLLFAIIGAFSFFRSKLSETKKA